MTGSVDIYSDISESLKHIYEAHWETGNEVNSKSGAAIMKATRNALSQGQTFWHVEYKDGVRKLVKTNISKDFGDIVNKQGVMIQTRLQNLIQFRTYSTKGTTVVTAPMKGGTTEIREGGKVTGSTKVDSVGVGSINILRKLNFGLNSKSNTINKTGHSFSWQGKPSIESFEGKHKALDFIEQGRRDSFGKVQTYIQQGFQEGLSRREKNVKAKMTKVA